MTATQKFTDNALDLSEYVQPGRRGNRPFEGHKIELVPYLSGDQEIALDKARRDLGENPDNEQAYDLIKKLVATGSLHSTLDWDVTDPEAWGAAPSRLVLMVMNELLGVEPPKQDETD